MFRRFVTVLTVRIFFFLWLPPAALWLQRKSTRLFWLQNLAVLDWLDLLAGFQRAAREKLLSVVS